MRTVAAMTARHRHHKAKTPELPFEQKPWNQPAPHEKIRRWVGEESRLITTPKQAQHRLRQASRDTDACRLTKGCDAQHHVQLANAIRNQWAVFLKQQT